MKRKHQIKFAQHGGTARVIAYLLLRMWMTVCALLVALASFVFLPATVFAQHEAQSTGSVMGMGANVGQVLGMMKEFIRPNLPKLYINEHFLIHKIGGPKPGMPKVATGANARPYRVPLELLAGFKGFTGQPDGGALQRGSGPTTDAGTLVPVYIYQAGEWTKATEINTNSDKKAIEDYATLMAERALDQFNTLMESLIQGDGSFTLDTVVSTAVNQLTVNNANQFYDNQDIDCWTALSGAFLGTVTILSVDAPNKQLNLTGAVPGGVVAGTLLLLNGAAGVSNSGLFGIKYFQVQANTGSVMNLQRAAYPGKLSTPHVAAGGNSLTPAIARRIEGQMIAALGVKAGEDAELLAHMNTDMAAAWENVAQNVSSIIFNQVKGDSQPDMLKRKTPATFAGHEIMRSTHATPARIDLLHLKSWFKIENQPMDFYDVAGQTEFPIYGANGAPLQSTASWLWNGVNFGNENVRAGAYVDGLSAPTGF
jgi:hypothetical protein